MAHLLRPRLLCSVFVFVCGWLWQIETRNGTLIISTANKKVEFKYYDTPKKKYKDMKKSYVSGMLQV